MGQCYWRVVVGFTLKGVGMNTQQATALTTIAGGAMGGIKLVVIGACLAVGFSIGNLVVRKSVDVYDGWKYSRLEKKYPEPEEKDSDTS
jgi:hypothetical protein